jgi:predicted flavoprotein YhiN
LKTDVLIIGAGAAGLMCAITAGQRGRSVLVVDHANKVGKKILMSGGGRCNFTNLGGSRQRITVKQGIEQPVAKKLVAGLKAAKLKVEAQINGDKLRVSGKKRDDLQLAMAVLRKTDVELPLQFDNFRD